MMGREGGKREGRGKEGGKGERGREGGKREGRGEEGGREGGKREGSKEPDPVPRHLILTQVPHRSSFTFGGISTTMEAAVQGREETGSCLVKTRRLLLTFNSTQPFWGWTGSS